MDTIRQQALALAPCLSALRRDLHKHPETAWTEYRTAALVIQHLSALGYSIHMGSEAVCVKARWQEPDIQLGMQAATRAVNEGIDAGLVEKMRGGLTGVWADLECPGPGLGAQGPVVALRFDMDANGIRESSAVTHLPVKERFASVHDMCMHACGHDGHTAIGMGVAAVLAQLRASLCGTIRLIFQPAEEGGQGALPMCEAGAVADVDYLIGLHLGIRTEKLGQLVCGTTHFLATTTFEMTFNGQAAHAGMAPHAGRNALLAACTAVQAMQGIHRHGEGASRINIGQLHVDGAANVVPSRAWLLGETRGVTDAIDAYMMDEVRRMAEGAATMWHCTHDLHLLSQCPSGHSSPLLAERVAEIARDMGDFTEIIPQREFLASEDFTCFLSRVQAQGGEGTYIQLGTQRASGHHTELFDFDEAALPQGVELLCRLVQSCLSVKNGIAC